MSWYVDEIGKQVWVDNDEVVYTVEKPPEELPVAVLTYLTTGTRQAVYAEHLIDEEAGGKNKKAKDRQSGQQRGYVVRVDKETRGVDLVVSAFKGVTERLLSAGVVSYLDIDNSSDREGKKKRNRRKNKESASAGAEAKAEDEPKEEKEEEPAIVAPVVPLGPNECRVETIARCQHNAHGTGFRVEVACDDGTQRIHFFTAEKDLPTEEWYKHVAEAVRATGARVMDGRLPITDAAPGSKEDIKKKADNDEDDWMASLMGRCTVGASEPKKEKSRTVEKQRDSEDAGLDESSETSKAKGASETAAAKSGSEAEKKLPPWLRSRKKQTDS